MGRFVAFSFALHLAAATLLALAPDTLPRKPVEEKIVLVNLVTIPAPPRPTRAVETPPAPRPQPPPPRPDPPAPAPRAPREKPRQIRPVLPPPTPRDIVVPDLLAKAEAPRLPETSLKEKVAGRLAPLPEPPAAEPTLKERTQARLAPPPQPPSPPPPARTAAPAPPSAAGAALVMDAGNFPHAWYVSIVQGKIYESWSPPQRLSAIRPGARAAVAFRIQRNGRTSRVSLREPSGYTLLDRSALEAVRTAGDFPPLPADYREEYLDVVVTFSPTLD